MTMRTEAGTIHLTISSRDKVEREHVLTTNTITIGRAPHNKVVIEDQAISAQHAVIAMVNGEAVLEDRDSTNGTRVNGQPVKKHFLRDGDIIELGRYTMRFGRTPQ